MMATMNATFEIASPIYSKTNDRGSVIAAGTSPTKVVRVRAGDLICDFEIEHAAADKFTDGCFKFSSEEAGVTRKEMRRAVRDFARTNS